PEGGAARGGAAPASGRAPGVLRRVVEEVGEDRPERGARRTDRGRGLSLDGGAPTARVSPNARRPLRRSAGLPLVPGVPQASPLVRGLKTPGISSARAPGRRGRAPSPGTSPGPPPR